MSQKKKKKTQGTGASTSLESSVSLLILIVEKRPLLLSYGQKFGSIGHRIIELLVAFVFRKLLHSWAPVLLIFLCISS